MPNIEYTHWQRCFKPVAGLLMAVGVAQRFTFKHPQVDCPTQTESNVPNTTHSCLIIPHSDGAGVIEAVGEGVAAERVGERVWIYQ